MSKFPISIIFMTDYIVDNREYSVERNDAEGNSRKVAHSIRDTLESLCNNVIMFESVESYTEQLSKFKNWVVFSTRYGIASRSSKAQVPAICEANGIRFIGADSYTHMLCNDKYLSKKYISEFGLKTAPSVLIRDASDSKQLNMISLLRFPVVIKPNYGGGSTGITSNSVQYSLDGAKQYVKELQNYHNQPILVEEYIPGYEVEVIVFGNQHRILLFDEIQIVLNGQEYFTEAIYDLQTKKIDEGASSMVHTTLLNEKDKNAMIRLFQSFSKVEYMRIDCRIYNGHAYIIELSPDCYLGEDSGVHMAFKKHGISFPGMFSLMIQNSLSPNCLEFL